MERSRNGREEEPQEGFTVLRQVEQLLDCANDWDTAALKELRAIYKLLDRHIGISGRM